MKIKGKRVVIILLVLLLSLGTVGAYAALGNTENKSEGTELTAAEGVSGDTETGDDNAGSEYYKEEVVYANLNFDGSIAEIYTVSIFDSPAGTEIIDIGNYSGLINLTDTSELKYDGGAVSFMSPGGRFYYQGYLKEGQLPWLFDVTYKLDGEIQTPERLSGADGALEIVIAVKINPAAPAEYADNYMTQLSITLDTLKCINIEAPGATAANAGSSKMLTWSVMPGAEAEFNVKADVRDFAFGGIEANAVPLSMKIELPDTIGLTSGLVELSDAIALLNDGASELSGGIAAYSDGAGEFAAGTETFGTGLGELAAQSGEVTAGSAAVLGGLRQLTDGLADALADMGAGTGTGSGTGAGASTGKGAGAGTDMLTQLSELTAGLGSLRDGLDGAAAGIDAIAAGFMPAFQALDGAITALPDTMYDISPFMSSGDAAILGLVKAYTDQYQSAAVLKGTYAQIKQAFEAVNTNLPELSARLKEASAGLSQTLTELNTGLGAIYDGESENNSASGAAGIAGIAESLAVLYDGLNTLCTNYAEFDTGLAKFTKGVGKINTGYSEIVYGASALADGAANLNGGAEALTSGTSELHANTADMDTRIENEIDTLLSGFDKSGYRPTSFVSADNGQIDAVQFVLKIAGVDEAAHEIIPVNETVKMTFWDKLLHLFGLCNK